jgi:hypothetical protein
MNAHSVAIFSGIHIAIYLSMNLEKPKLKLMINSLSFFNDDEIEDDIQKWENDGGNNFTSNTEIKIKPKKLIDEYKNLKNKKD